jgi:nitrate/TMAO reductase-like tetraheme cytochrome c subunit
MAQEEDESTTRRRGPIARLCRWLFTPSARFSVFVLLCIGIILGAAAIIGTQVMVAATGTNEFCGGACHSMQWVDKEYRQSVHFANRTGVRAECHDCHIPHAYPYLLWYKAKAGVKDVVQEVRGVIGTEEKFKKERLRMAKEVWAEMKDNGSRNCRHCHIFTAEIVAKQKEFVRPMHQQVLAKTATCVDCHKGVAHTAPDE